MGQAFNLIGNCPLQKGRRWRSTSILPHPPRKGSPQAWLTHLTGTLTPDEGERILAGAGACRTIDADLWSSPES